MNLLPPENKVIAKKEYLRRLFVTAGVFLFSTSLIAALFLASFFFALNLQKKSIHDSFFAMQEYLSAQNESELTFLVSRINAQVAELNSNQKRVKKASEIIERIIEIKGNDISIESFAFNLSRLDIKGNSASRSGLINFVENLKKQDAFSAVESPLSNFLKEKNIDFSINIKLVGYE